MSSTEERAILAGGCFWGMQDLLRRSPGVVSTRVGYSGGDVKNATYRNHGTHAEAIEIVFDPEARSYRKLLEIFFPESRPDPAQPPRERHGNELPFRNLLHQCGTEARCGTDHCRREPVREVCGKGGNG